VVHGEGSVLAINGKLAITLACGLNNLEIEYTSSTLLPLNVNH
jgi:hypothetical protein